MAFTRTPYMDTFYEQSLQQSAYAGRYQLDTEAQACKPCYAEDSRIRLQRIGASTNAQFTRTEVETDLWNLNRPPTRTNQYQYHPGNNPVNNARLTHYPSACADALIPEDTRLSNPPCTLRGTGWNRHDFLCQDPQFQVERPFAWDIQNRILVKDQHKPCVRTPQDQSMFQPAGGPPPIQKVQVPCTTPLGPASVPNFRQSHSLEIAKIS